MSAKLHLNKYAAAVYFTTSKEFLEFSDVIAA
jgi:hypothetical protein